MRIQRKSKVKTSRTYCPTRAGLTGMMTGRADSSSSSRGGSKLTGGDRNLWPPTLKKSRADRNTATSRLNMLLTARMTREKLRTWSNYIENKVIYTVSTKLTTRSPPRDEARRNVTPLNSMNAADILHTVWNIIS